MFGRSKKEKKGSGLLTGMIVGGAIGSVASMLFTTEKGGKVRGKMEDKGKELIEEGKTKAEEFLEKYKDQQ